MQRVRTVLVIFLSAWLMLPVGAQAQQPPALVDQATLDKAVAAHVQRSDADRAAIRQLLERQAVRDAATRAGIDLSRAESAIATLEAAELHEIAVQARAVDESLSGGASITLTTTTIIIGLLVLILLIVALK